MKNKIVLISLLTVLAFSCKKNEMSPVVIDDSFQPGDMLTVANGTDMTGARFTFNPDTVYAATDNGLVKFRPLPAAFNDSIVSIYIPKGYIATFAENSDGTGVSFCYVAVQASIQKNLGDSLSQKVSFIRYIKVNNPTKRGTCAVDTNVVKQFNTSGWWYGWSFKGPSIDSTQYVPMTWGKGAANFDNVKYLLGRSDVDHLLSFNEPDNSNQANITSIDTAVTRYKIMLQSGVRLGAPATSQDEMLNPVKWGTKFMAMAKDQKARIDFIPLHWYDWSNQNNNRPTDSLTAEAVFSRFKNYMIRIHDAYPEYKLWLTEYNCNGARTSTVVHQYFMKLSTEWMNETDYIERYSYFFPNSVPAKDASGNLTPTAIYWNNLYSTPSLPTNIE